MKKQLKEKNEWFEEWFDTPYYHILYKNRDENEAQEFISNLINFLKPSKNSLFLDVACGKGRHAFYLNKLGFNVDGFDLSENSIESAKQYESERLHFYINDIRKPLKVNQYNYAFNLFTSFGYFDSNQDNQLAIDSITESLVDNGIVVLDFMNCSKVINNLVEGEEIKVINDISFHINKSFDTEYIIKDINFVDQNKEYHFQEKVKAISLDDFKSYFASANLKIESIFGDYRLNPFDVNSSDRLILVARKQ